MRLLSAAVLFLASALAAPPASAARSHGPATEPGQFCRHAILMAEREHRLPPALLHAIARVESGRIDPRTGAAVSWPWTVTVGGQGRFFDSKEEAVAAVRALQARGTTVIDVGCMQVNLHHHPRAFAGLDEAFDPAANARYAALFLTRLQKAAGNWERAAAHYHSHTPERADAYRLKVLAAWPGMAHRLAAERAQDAEAARREAMIAAWTGKAAFGAGFQPAAAASLPPPGTPPGQALRTQAAASMRPAAQSRRAAKPSQRTPLQEMAEASPRRR